MRQTKERPAVGGTTDGALSNSDAAHNFHKPLEEVKATAPASGEVGTFIKNGSEVVRVAFESYRGQALLDVRIYADYQGSGRPAPTRKGISLRVAQLPELITLLRQAEAVARQRGLV